jgi:serine/threonine protein kinase
MSPIYCSETREVIPPEYFAQGKAVFCGGKPYLQSVAERLGLQVDDAVPPEYTFHSDHSQNTTPVPRSKTRKVYCTITFEHIPLDYFADGRAIWCGGKPYLLAAALQRGLAPDPAPPSQFAGMRTPGVDSTPTPPPLPVKRPPPLPPSAQRTTGIVPGNDEPTQESVAAPSAGSADLAGRLREQLENRPWSPDAAAPAVNVTVTPTPFHFDAGSATPPPVPAPAVPPGSPTPTPFFFRPSGTPTPTSRHRQTSIGLVIGQKLFGRYDVKKVLGKGAMGEVLHVRDMQSHMDYALKRLPENMSPEKREAVRRNFHLTSQLTHPHIATTRNLEIDPKTGNIFILMDLVRGVDMSKWLTSERQKRGSHNAPLPLELSICIAEQIASALDYAHSQPIAFDEDGRPEKFGALHRDLKPANVMIEPTRQYRPGVPYVRIVDFGLATESQGALDDISQPQRNKKAGTPAYMAPEQWEGRTLTRGVDQWALAVILYEMIAGERPFWDNTEFLLAQKIMHADPPKPATLSDAQFAAFKKTFNVNRRERHHSCLALIKALAAADPATKNLVLAAEFPMPEDFLTQLDDD